MKQTQDGGNVVLDSSKLQQAQEDNPFIKITDAVYKILEEAILSSKLKPGSRLKINTIAEELQVSTSPVREAIEMLSAKACSSSTRRRAANIKTIMSSIWLTTI